MTISKGATRREKLSTGIVVQMKRVFYVLMFFLFLSSIAITVGTAEEDNYRSKFCITNISPTEFRPAESSTISITLKNIGNRSAYHVATEILIDDTSPVKVIGKAKKSVGHFTHHSIGRDREATVQYEIYVDKYAEIGVYYIPLRVIWGDKPEKEGNMSREILNIGIRVIGCAKEAKIDILNVTTVPEVLKPGQEGVLKVQLKNIGYSTINSLKVRLSVAPPFTPIRSDLDEYIATLNPNETVGVNFNVGVDRQAESKHYELNLQLEYEDETARVNLENSTIGIKVKGRPTIYIQEIILEPSKLTRGTSGLFMVRLINTGTEDAEDVKIRISGAKDILTEGHQFIGEIASGESQTTTFGIFADKEAKIGKHGLKISISYEDKFGASYANSKIYEISIFPSKPFIPRKYIYALIAIVALSAIVYLIILVRFKK